MTDTIDKKELELHTSAPSVELANDAARNARCKVCNHTRIRERGEGMKSVISVILMREDVPYQNKTLRSLLNAIIVSIWLAGFILLMFGIFSIYQLFV